MPEHMRWHDTSWALTIFVKDLFFSVDFAKVLFCSFLFCFWHFLHKLFVCQSCKQMLKNSQLKNDAWPEDNSQQTKILYQQQRHFVTHPVSHFPKNADEQISFFCRDMCVLFCSCLKDVFLQYLNYEPTDFFLSETSLWYVNAYNYIIQFHTCRGFVKIKPNSVCW